MSTNWTPRQQAVLDKVKRLLAEHYIRQQVRQAMDEEWDESKHPRAANGQFGSGGQSAMKSVKANIARGRLSMNVALTEKRTVHRAMYHNELGWIDFEWGSEGRLKPSGKTKGAMGLSHIIEARMRKDKMSYQEVAQMLTERVTETIAKGRVADRAQVGEVSVLKLDYRKNRTVLRKAKGSNAWVVTAFELFEGDQGKADGKSPVY